MAYPLIPPKSQWVDANGNPMVGGKLEFRDPSTDALKNTYPTADDADAQTNPNDNPVTLDSRGEAAIFLEDGATYKVTMYDANSVQQWTVDDVAVASSPGASQVSITDSGGYYVASNVEAALQELGASTGAAIIGIADGGGYYSATDVEGALQSLGASTGAGIVGINDSGGYFASTDVEGALQELGQPAGSSSVQLLMKRSSTGRSNNTESNDPHLASFSVAENTCYAIEGYLGWEHTGGDLKFSFAYTISPTARSYQAAAVDETGVTDFDLDDSGLSMIIDGIAVGQDAGCNIKGYVWFGPGVGTGTGGLKWACNTITGTTTLKQGSWIRFTPFDVTP